jgi:PKD repeat protein
MDCDSYLFQIPGTLVDVTWSFGDGTSENSGNSADHTFQADGIYIVTASYTSELCNEGVTIIYTLEVNCNSECPSNIVPNYNCDLGTVTLIVDGLNQDASLVWWWGNYEVLTETPSITLEYSNSWIFICAWSDSLQTEGCPEVCEEIYLGCEENCNLNIGLLEDGCEILVLSATGVPNPQNVQWSINGEFYNVGSITTFYLSPGANQICAWYEGELCSDEWCETFQGCGECTEVGFSLDSFVGEGGPNLVTWSLANQNGLVVYEGMSEYNGEDPFYDHMFCLENGCYVFNVCSTEPFMAEAFDVLFSDNWNVVSSESVSTFLCYGYTVLLSLNSDCEAPECTEVILGIDSYQINGGAHLINWFVFDEMGNTVADGVHEYSENNSYFDTALCLPDGCYTVGIQDMTTGEFSYETLFTFATSDGIPLDIIQPLVIENQFASFGFSLNGDCIVEECTDNEVTITVTSSYIEAGSDMFDMTLNYENFPLELEGFFMCSECPEELTYTFCLADGCYEIDFETEFPISAEFIMVQAYLNGIEIPEALLEMIQGDEGGSLVIGLNSDCEDSVSEIEMVEWELYPNPSNEVINISLSQTQNAQVRIFDMTGKLVLENSINGYGKQIDISSLVSGVYSVVLIGTDTLSSKVLEVVR